MYKLSRGQIWPVNKNTEQQLRVIDAQKDFYYLQRTLWSAESGVVHAD